MEVKPTDVERIFNRALQKDVTDGRAAYVDNACGNDADLRGLVEALLSAHDDARSFLKSSTLHPAGLATASPALREGPGTTVGRYKLQQLIGEGGFGSVYLAAQERPVHRKVALKIIKLGMDTKQVIARFEAERQALALMDHPNIAKVLDAGATETGRPYFVMELVEGIPMTEYCDTNGLSTAERLNLFTLVCNALQHAHQKGIIHRDIKPSNVLVALCDGRPVPKVIDFGIAKATHQRLTEKTILTEFRQLVGTPEYMSPEQATMDGLDVDTRSDIYSLGVLLYELLTGTTPFDRDKLRQATYAEIQRIIREEEPPKPSTRVGHLGSESAGVTRNRHSDAGSLQRELRGDLDWITMKCLQKDRTRRYASATELAADLLRHLAHEPVAAGPPGVVYRLRKSVRRNRRLMAGLVVVFAVLAAGVVTSTWFAIQATRARDEAERQGAIAREVNEFLNHDLLGAVVPARAGGHEVTVREVLDQVSKAVDGKFKDRPLVEAGVHQTLGEAYRGLGDYPQAEPHLERALMLRREGLGEEHPDTLTSINGLGTLYMYEGRYGEVEPLLVRALRLLRRTVGEDHPLTLDCMRNLGVLYRIQGRYDEAESLHLRALEVSRRALGDEHPHVLDAMNNLAMVYKSQGRHNAALPLFLQTLELRRRVLGEEHPDTLVSTNNLAALYTHQGRYEEAEPLYVRVFEVHRRVLGEEHSYTLMSMNNLATLYMRQGRYDEAEPLLLETLELQRRVLGEEHSDTLRSLGNLASLYKDQGRYDDAEPLCDKTLELRRRVLGEEHPETLRAVNNLAVLYMRQGRYDKAEVLLGQTLELSRRVLGDEHLSTLLSLGNLASLYKYQGRYEAAEPLLVQTLDVHRRVLGMEHPDTLVSQSKLASLYKDQGRYDEAEPLLEQTLQLRRRVLGMEHPDTLVSQSKLASLYKDQGRYDEAEPLLEQTLELRRRVLRENHPRTLTSIGSLAGLYVKQGRYDEAEPLYAAAVSAARTALPDKHWKMGMHLYNYGCLATKLERYADAEAMLLESREILETALGVTHRRTIKTIRHLVELYDAWGRPDQAAEWRTKLPTPTAPPRNDPARPTDLATESLSR